MSDLLTQSLNAPSGHLAGILISKLSSATSDEQPRRELCERLDKLVRADGAFGKLARVRLASEVSLLFHHIPEWTTTNIVPLFDWSSPEAGEMWSARKYSGYIGAPELVGLTKKALLELFNRIDVSEDERRTYAEWIAAMVLANQKYKVGYPISTFEARTALRQAGAGVLGTVAHQFAMEMERTVPDEKLTVWREIVGPVFKAIWPLDRELQLPSTSFHLVFILREAGAAFPEAADDIIPFIRPEDPFNHTSVHSIADADDLYYSSWPDKLLDLLAAVVGDAPAGSAYGLNEALIRLKEHAPSLVSNKRFQKLQTIAGGV